jgi:hypothetical protein
MHHYRCQNVYISTTANERIVDTLELFPHNYQMPQLSSTDRLLVVAKDMTDALQNPHLEVPLASVGDDTIAALTDLATIFKFKYNKLRPPQPNLRLPRLSNARASLPHQPKSGTHPCPWSDERDHR